MKRLLIIVALLAVALAGCTTPTPTASPIVTPTPSESPLATPEVENRVEDDTRIEKLKTESQTMEEKIMSLQELLAVALFLSMVANRIIEVMATPFFDRFKWDKFWLMPASWVVGGALSAASGINLFAAIPSLNMNPVIGLVLSAVVTGGGSNLLNELFDVLGQGRRLK